MYTKRTLNTVVLIVTTLALTVGYLLSTYVSRINPPLLTIQYQCMNWHTTEW